MNLQLRIDHLSHSKANIGWLETHGLISYSEWTIITPFSWLIKLKFLRHKDPQYGFCLSELGINN